MANNQPAKHAKRGRTLHLFTALSVTFCVIIASLGLLTSAYSDESTLVTGTPSYLPIIYRPENTPLPPAPKLEQGYYSVDLSGDVFGFIYFWVYDDIGISGELIAYDAAFLYEWNSPPDCGARFWNFSPGYKSIVNGRFEFAAVSGVTLQAKMECFSETSTRAVCTVQEPDYGGPWLGACGRSVTSPVFRQ